MAYQSFKTNSYDPYYDGTPNHVVVSWNIVSQSIETNSSEIIVTMHVSGGKNSYWWNTVYERYITVKGSVGEAVTLSSSYEQEVHNDDCILTGRATVKHDEYGICNLQISAGVAFYSSGYYNSTGSESWLLPEIPTKLKVLSKKVALSETSFTIYWTTDKRCSDMRYSIDNVTSWRSDNITYNADGVSGTVGVKGLTANTTYNVKLKFEHAVNGLWTETETWKITTYSYPYCTVTPDFVIGDALTLEFFNPLKRKFKVTGYGGDSKVIFQSYGTGEKLTGFNDEATIKMLYESIDSGSSNLYWVDVEYADANSLITTDNGNTYEIRGDEAPTINELDYQDDDSGVVEITGDEKLIVQNISKLCVFFEPATPKVGARIVKYTVSCNGISVETDKTYAELGEIDSSKDVDLTLTAIDSRGLSASKTIKVAMLAHADPSAIVALERLNNYEDEAYITVDGSVSSVAEKNTMTIRYRYKEQDGSYGKWFNAEDRQKQTLSLDKNKIYIFNIIVEDAFGATFNKEYTLGKGVFPLFIDTGMNSVGMNALPRGKNVFEVGGYLLENKREFSIPISGGGGTNHGWYLALSGNMTGYQNRGIMLAIQETYGGGAGILYLNLRCNNEIKLTIPQFHWLTFSEISSANIVVKTQGNNFYLYLQTEFNYQQYYIKVLQEKVLNDIKNFALFTVHTPTYDDMEKEAPVGTSPKTIKEMLGLG